MAGGNCTAVTEFILTGVTDHPELQVPLFVVFLVIYVITLVWNLGMMVLIRIDPRLHTPMYFFLKNLSLVDACYSTVITPKMLMSFLAERKAISYTACIIQYFSFILLVISECLLLAVMAYDRYVAICNPLLYMVIMSPKHCLQLVAGSYLWAFLNSVIHTSGLLRLSYCDSNILNHFFCDINPLLKLSSSGTSINQLLVFLFGSLIEVISIVTILISYILIIVTVLRIRSTEGRRKAFYTCTSHLTAVSMFHGTILFMYFRPSTSYSLDTDKMASVFYTVVIPVLNPLIYSLRNKDVKDALRRAIETKLRAHFSPKGVRIGQPNPPMASLHT
ncbi:olfactory receptor-like protein COR4 [Mauremys mutica]|uniref:olfactory receptor-like protein COR4 n=1 Tax=Mauremys mutica TaxID=74926 RepID=UPI001D16E5E8|nr:olfactory receptor-like protein COR4 [Mauremys mutica]XP_044869718.1 olfactory receptor-like protein COR4 [Mauremys mutica]